MNKYEEDAYTLDEEEEEEEEEEDNNDDDQYGDDDEYIPIDISDPFGLNNNNNNNRTTTTTTTTSNSTNNINSANNNNRSQHNNNNNEDYKSYIIPSTANLGRTLDQLERDQIFLEQLHKKFSDQLYRLKLEETLLEEQKQNRKQ